jgi:hypothetical protein
MKWKEKFRLWIKTTISKQYIGPGDKALWNLGQMEMNGGPHPQRSRSFHFNGFLHSDSDLKGLWMRKLNSGTIECVKRNLMHLFRFVTNWPRVVKNLVTRLTEIRKAMLVVKINCLLLKQWNHNMPYSNMCERNEQENVKSEFQISRYLWWAN